MPKSETVSIFQESVASSTRKSLQWLIEHSFITWEKGAQSYCPLPLGKATSAGSLRPQQALIVQRVPALFFKSPPPPLHTLTSRRRPLLCFHLSTPIGSPPPRVLPPTPHTHPAYQPLFAPPHPPPAPPPPPPVSSPLLFLIMLLLDFTIFHRYRRPYTLFKHGFILVCQHVISSYIMWILFFSLSFLDFLWVA